jgi:hypothetical protein
MGNCNRKQSPGKKQPKGKKVADKLVSTPIKTVYTNNLNTIYESVIKVYTEKRTMLPCIYMNRNNNIHITTRILNTDTEKINSESLAELIERLENYFNQLQISHEIYIKSEEYDTACNTTKLYIHLKSDSN